MVTNTVLIRRLKKDVLHQLPPKSRQQVFIEIAAKHRKELAALQKQAAAIDVRIQSSTGTTKQAAENERRSLTVKMYSLTGQAKVHGHSQHWAFRVESLLIPVRISRFQACSVISTN